MKKDLYFLSKDKKTNIHAVIYENAGVDRPKAVVQIIHGMTEYIGRYDRFARRLLDQGFVVTGHDHLGHGKSVNDWGDYGYFSEDSNRTLIKDMHQLRINLSKRYPGIPYFMIGHSMGSYLLREYLADYGEGLAGAVIMGTGYAMPAMASFGILTTKIMAAFRGWHYRSFLVQGLTYGPAYRSYSLTGTDIKRNWLTKDLKAAKDFWDDPLCGFLFTLNGHRGLFQTVRASCLRENAEKIPKSLPLLLVSGEEDPVGDLGKGVRKSYKLYKDIGIKNVKIKLYPGDRHEILNECDRDQVEKDIINWLEFNRDRLDDPVQGCTSE